MAAKSPVRAMAGPRGGADGGAQLVGHHRGERGLAQALEGPRTGYGPPRSPRALGRRDHDAEGLLHLRLAQVVVEPLGTQGEIELQVVLGERRGHRALAPGADAEPCAPAPSRAASNTMPSMSRSNAMISYRLPKRFRAYCSSAPSPAPSGAPLQGHLGLGGGEAHGEQRLGGAPAAADCARARPRPGSNSDSMPPSKVPFSSKMMRSAVFFPTPGIWDTRAMSWEAMASASSAGRERRKCRQGHLRPYLRHADELLEQRLLLLGEKAEQRDAVLRHGQVGEHARLPRPRPACPGRPPAWPRRSPRRRHRCRPSAAAAPPPRFRSETQSCEPSILVGRVADGRRQRVGRMVRLGNAIKREQMAHHVLHLVLLGRALPHHGELYLAAGYTRPRQGRPRRRPRAPPRGPGPWRRRP